MQALAFWKAVTDDRVDLLDRIFELLDSRGVRYCLIEGRGVNADDVLRGKVWAAQDPERRASKRQKDLAHIARLIEAFPTYARRSPPTSWRSSSSRIGFAWERPAAS